MNHILIKTERNFYPIRLFTHTDKDQRSTMSHVTWQEGLLHGLHQTLQVVFYIIHHNVDLVHITSNNYFLMQGKNKS